MNTTSRCLSTLLAIGSVGYITVGHNTNVAAGGFSTARFGGEHGNAASEDVTSLWYNPAGIALAGGTHIYVEGFFAYRTVDYARDAGTVDNPDAGTPHDALASNIGHAHLADPIASPFAGITTDLGKKGLGLGLSLSVPFGGQAKWDKNDRFEGSAYPGAVDGTQRWAIIEGQQRSVYLTAAAAYATPGKSLAFGAGVSVVMDNISLDRARNALGTDDVASEGNALLEVSGTHASLGVGVQWRPTSKLRLGAAYQSQPGFGQEQLDGKLTTKFGSSDANVDEVVLLQRIPDMARVAAEIDVTPNLMLRLHAEWQNWSVYDGQCLLPKEDPSRRCAFNPDGSIDTEDTGAAQSVLVNLPRNYHDGYNFRGGLAWHKDALELGGSVMYDANVVPDETMDPGLFDMNKVISQAELDYAMKQVSLRVTLGDVYYMRRTTAPRATDPEAPSRNPDMAGTYRQSVGYVIVGLGFKL
jgi:long-chain fatty acid transport protein